MGKKKDKSWKGTCSCLMRFGKDEKRELTKQRCTNFNRFHKSAQQIASRWPNCKKRNGKTKQRVYKQSKALKRIGNRIRVRTKWNENITSMYNSEERFNIPDSRFKILNTNLTTRIDRISKIKQKQKSSSKTKASNNPLD